MRSETYSTEFRITDGWSGNLGPEPTDTDLQALGTIRVTFFVSKLLEIADADESDEEISVPEPLAAIDEATKAIQGHYISCALRIAL